MGLEQQLNDTLKQAIKDQDLRTADVVRMLKTKLMERRTAKGFSGQVDDALVLDVISAYRKQLLKALAEFEKAGDRAASQVTQIRFETEFCERYLHEDAQGPGRGRRREAHRRGDPRRPARVTGPLSPSPSRRSGRTGSDAWTLSLGGRRVSGGPPGGTSVSARSAWTALDEGGCGMDQGLGDPSPPR